MKEFRFKVIVKINDDDTDVDADEIQGYLFNDLGLFGEESVEVQKEIKV